jgi:hypothetical protein
MPQLLSPGKEARYPLYNVEKLCKIGRKKTHKKKKENKTVPFWRLLALSDLSYRTFR